MHYQLEIIMPPVPESDIERRIGQIMEPFDENGEDVEGPAFWDFWIIGGRYSQRHLTSNLDGEKLDTFYARMIDEGVTVSGVQCGKQEIRPADQIPKVDALWKEIFPDFPGDHCPLFKHGDSSSQYDHHAKWPDVMAIGELPEGATAYHLIVAHEADWHDDKPFRAKYMIEKQIWNGVIHAPTQWDGTIAAAIEGHHERIERLTDEAREKLTVRPDWLAVTVDYHS